MRVLVTRPLEQAGEWVQRLRAAAIEAVALPLIEIAPATDRAPLAAAWASLARRALVMFVSPNAVAHFFAARPAPDAWPAALLAASTGPATSAALARAGVARERIVEPAPDAAQFDSEALWLQLQSQDWRGREVLVVRGDGGRDWLAQRLRAAGAAVEAVQAYRRTVPTLDAAQRAALDAALASPRGHLWWFGSAQAIDHLETLAGAAVDWRQAHALATHERIAERARRLGFGTVECGSPAADAVLAAITRSIQSRQ